MKRLFFLVLVGCGEQVAAPEGVFTMCREVEGYSGETIELKGGTFRYWFYSDAGTDSATYPLTGSYCFSGSVLTLNHPSIHRPTRSYQVVNGVPVLWRDDGLALFQKEERFQPYAVLIRVEGEDGDPAPEFRPSISLLKSAELKKREAMEYENRYSDATPACRALLRARTFQNDPDLVAYRKEILRAREKMDAALIGGLVARMGTETAAHVEASMTLRDLFEAPFADTGTKRKALACLRDGLASAKDRYGVEEPLLVFLRAAGIRTIDLAIPEAGVRLKLEILPSGYSSDCGAIDGRAGKPKTWKWTDEIKDVIPAVQKWMSSQLEE